METKTIEERASFAALRILEEIGISKHSVDRVSEIIAEKLREQKAIDGQVRLEKCDMTEAEHNRETAFVDWYLENGKGTLTYSDAIEWSRKEVINKACEWFEGYLAEIGYPDDWCRDSKVQESGEKRFRKAMEE